MACAIAEPPRQIAKRPTVQIAFAQLDDVDARIEGLVEPRFEREDPVASCPGIRGEPAPIRDQIHARPRQRDHEGGETDDISQTHQPDWCKHVSPFKRFLALGRCDGP